MATVTDAQAAELVAAARHWGMDALIEVHDLPEAERALTLDMTMLGVNNRNLNTFEDGFSIRPRTLARMVPEGCLLVSESGLRTPEDLDAMAGYGARCFLIGESLMRQD